MFKMIWGAIKGAVGGAIGSTNVGGIMETLGDLYLQRADAKSAEAIAKIDAEIEVLKMQATASSNQQGYWMTAWIRPAFAGVTLFYYAKILVWDAALHLGTTDPVNDLMVWSFTAIIGFYFLVRPFEKR